MVIFFGDSLTEGSNCKHTFTDYLPGDMDVFNLGVSGTTIGEYSIYPVDGNSLLRQIEKYEHLIKNVTHVFIEYGSNDVASIMCGFATAQTVVVSFVKAVDWIKQINPGAKIVFLTYGSDAIVENRGQRMCDYLENDYFAKFNFNFPNSVYVQAYKTIVHDINKVCDTMTMFDDDMLHNMDEYISDDNIHPNEKGHKRICENIIRQFYSQYI